MRTLYFAVVVSSSFFFLFFFFSRLFSAVDDLSTNLECRSEMCCTRLAENTGRKNSPSIRNISKRCLWLYLRN